MTKIGGKICNFISLYRSLNHFEYDFENFYENLEITLDAVLVTNPFLIVATGDFKVKYNN